MSDLVEQADVGAHLDVINDPINRQIWDMLYRQGLSQAAVARQLGLHRSTIRARLKKILDAVPTIDPGEILTMKLEQKERLDELDAALWQNFLRVTTPKPVEWETDDDGNRTPTAFEDPDTLAISRMSGEVLKAMAERSRLFGLYAPKVISIEGVSREPLEQEMDHLRGVVEVIEVSAIEAA